MLTESVREHSQHHGQLGDMLLLSCLRVVIVKSLLPVGVGEIMMFGWWLGLEWGMWWFLLVVDLEIYLWIL